MGAGFTTSLSARTICVEHEGNRMIRDGQWKLVARGKAPGVFTIQPVDELSIGEDFKSAVGEYQAPFPLKGTVGNVKVGVK